LPSTPNLSRNLTKPPLSVPATTLGAVARQFPPDVLVLAVLWAAVLCAGPGAVLSYQTAAELAGLQTRPANLVHVTIPTNRRVVPRPGLVIHLPADHTRQAAPRPRASLQGVLADRVRRAADGRAAGLHSILERRYHRDVDKPHGLPAAQRPCEVAAEVARVLADRGFAGARRCSASCPVGDTNRRRRPSA